MPAPLTVIIPTFNEEDWVGAAIDSAVAAGAAGGDLAPRPGRRPHPPHPHAPRPPPPPGPAAPRAARPRAPLSAARPHSHRRDQLDDHCSLSTWRGSGGVGAAVSEMNCYILIGGSSSRMGQSKVDLFFERVAAAARDAFDAVFAVQRAG